MEVTSLLGQTARSCLMASSPNFPRAGLREGLAMCPFIFLDLSVLGMKGHLVLSVSRTGAAGWSALPVMAKPGTPLPPQTPSSAHGFLSFSASQIN